ncbi:helicase with zinc finger domain 2-like [Saccostrea echinata]|uniref:helicase with zinc finger domain 2-like n=1 Tax=Saccostrea echinata TaxID=191078 RepID=UPI002A84095E|nr:helicase with zinc finger domain 2-like [Saccostrea echinata]
MDLPWSDGIYPSDVPRDFEEVRNREERKERISLYWESMVNDKEPKVHKNALLHLMQDLKDEGNDLFKEGDFDNSWMHYRNALFIARILEVRFYHTVDKEFMSTLFSNRAFCCLKKEMYIEAIHDCDSAIQIFPGNIKAYYRQVLALKAQKRLTDALQVAEKGMETKPGVFKEILEELKEQIEEERNIANVSAKDAKPLEEREPDNEWLQGTNINITKQSEARQKMPSKKNKGKPSTKQSQPNGNINNSNAKAFVKSSPEIGNGVVEDDEVESDDTEGTDDRLSDDESFVSTFMNVRNTKLVSPGQNFHLKFPTTVDVSEPVHKSMGLDCFSPPAGKMPAKPDFPRNTPNISSSASSLSSRTSTPNPKAVSQSAMTEIKKIKFPMDENYDWRLACRQCFVKIGEGIRGFRYSMNLSHACMRDILLVRLRKEGMNWIKVRPRPESKFQQFVSYKICTHFSSGNPCAVGEEKCTFAHNTTEKNLWNMDRDPDEPFLLTDFISKLQQYKIDSNEELARLQSVDSSGDKQTDTAIPGLNYKSKQTKLTPPAPVEHMVSALKQPLLPTPPRGPIPPSNLPAAPIMNRPRIPGPPPPGFPDPYYMMQHPPPGMGPLHGMPFPHPMMRNRFPGQGPPRMMPPFSSPTSQAQIRPNMMRAPAPKPVADSTIHDDSSDVASTYNQEFPLSSTHDYKLVCKNCYKVNTSTGMYVYQPTQHTCEENILVVRQRHSNGQWLKIRERKNHRVFSGKYIMCNSIRVGGICRYGEDNCSFAHNDWEQLLWTMEKDEKFNITEFIIQSRSTNLEKGYSIADILQRHSGYLGFVCKACFYNQPQMINREGAEGKCSGKAKHGWSDYKILAHFSTEGPVTIINPRGFSHKTAFFKVCKWLHYCRNRINAECRFAHSIVERDLWMFERDTDFSQEKIVELSNKQLGISTNAPEMTTYTSEITPSATLYQPPTQPTATATPKAASQVLESKPVASVDEEEDDMCPFVIQELCLTCWKNGKKSIQDGSKDRCVKNHSNWKTNRVYLASPSNKEIRVLPRKIPSGFRFILCSYIEKRGKCGYTGGGPCQFAHSQEELEIWQWMCAHDVKKLEDLYKASKEAQTVRAAQTKNKAISGESVVSVVKRVTLPTQVKFSMHYCSYCGKQCNSEKQWDEHCASEKHNFNVNSDKEHQWNYRQPPWGLPGTNYELCYKHTEGKKCPYSYVPDMYNMCQYAHSEEELDEWKERYEWRQMKRDMARQEKVFSFMDELLEQYQSADQGIRVISEDIPDVVVTCEQELTIYEEEKNAVFTWIFNVKSRRTLEKVALLYNKDRLHFSLKESEMEKNTQIAPGTSFQIDNHRYQVEVQFTGNMFGSFNQWVIFDFGTLPVLVRKLYVEVGTIGTHEKVKSLREKLNFDRWTAENREIIRYEGANVDELERKLTSKYKAPFSSDSVISQHSVATELNWNNYHHKMHQLLEMEEMKRHQIISSYNLCKTITILESIQEQVYVYPQNGELFAKVPLAEYLTEDTDAGKLILTSVRNVLLAPQDRSTQSVYEGVIVRKDNFDYDGRGKEYMYLCLSSKCVQGLNLRHGMTLKVEIQFQMDRMWFCMMHYAVDHLGSTDVVFPDLSKIKPFHEKSTLRINSSVLNPDQLTAVQHIVTERVGYNPPFVIYGPFGTGKTETIAQAVMVLIRERPDSKILICAQSNSAADLYLTKHLDPFLRKTNCNTKIRRVYFKERRVNTVQPEVKKYCMLNSDRTAFEFPTHDDIIKHNIVIVTLSTSLLLSELGLQDYFTHIFVDEAAQTLEAEAIMPLSLASEKTCVVLAGDHQQISPKVYSPEAREQKFDLSLLERLFQYYESFCHKIDQTKPLNILLRINYRTKMEILRFISAIFYGGPEKLESRANLPSVLEITPLMFYAVQGVEIQDSDSISFYNMSEVQEVVERVQELYANWPAEWGEKNPKTIGVVTPYFDQVQLIRKALRKKHPDLKNITVERVNNVQGKEFRALFISTVRTRGLIDSQYKPEGECEGDGGYYGFLSDPKLLNTALTRAQSYVAVVGDPVALCAIGDCLNVWKTYLKHCQNMKSIHPPTLTLDSIKQQVSNLAQTPARQRMVEMSGQNKPQGQLTLPQEQTTLTQGQIMPPQGLSLPSQGQLMPAPLTHPSLQTGAWKQNKSGGSLLTNSFATPEVKPLARSMSQLNEIRCRPIPHPQMDRIVYSYDWSECYDTATDDLLKQMAEEAIRMERVNKQRDRPKAGPVYVELIDFKESNGHVELLYNDDSTQPTKNGDFKEIQLYDETYLQTMMQKYPERFKKCVFRKDLERMYVELVGQISIHGPIEIGNVRDSGTAMDGDEVVVEILPSEDVDELDLDNMDTGHHGRVVGILNRKIDPEYKCFVCCVDPDNTGIMIPVNNGAHKMYALSAGGEISSDEVPVYQISKEGRVKQSQVVKINPINCQDTLFVVRFLKWHPNLYLPLGITVGVIPVGTSYQSALNILNLEYDVKKEVSKAVEQEVLASFSNNYTIPVEEYSKRLNLREKWTFSIGPGDSEEIGQALSIEETTEGNYFIGVHVSDVTYFVKMNSNIDTEARNKTESFILPNKETIHMLPEKLSTDLCSIKPGVDRLTLSVFLTVSKSGEIIRADPRRCIISSKKKFNFKEIADILVDPDAASDYLKSCIIVLFHMSRIWRRQRLGNASLYQDIDVTHGDKHSPEAYLMLQELMIQTNHKIAMFLLQRFPSMVPLYCQDPPNETELEKWRQKHAADAINSVALTKPFLEGNRTCQCKMACTCIINYIKRTSNIKVHDCFDICQVLWQALCEAAESGNMNIVQNIIIAAESHPQLSVALMKLNSIQTKPKYVCSGDSVDLGHYSLNLAPYVHFVNPIGRYMDLVTHRMVLAAIEKSSVCYSQSDIKQLCSYLTNASDTIKKYQQAVQNFHLSLMLKSKPLILCPSIERINEDEIVLCFPPTFEGIPDSKRRIKMNLLSLREPPKLLDKGVQVSWQEQIYDPVAPSEEISSNVEEEVNPNQHILQIQSFHWQKLLMAIRDENHDKLQTTVLSVKDQIRNPAQNKNYTSEITTERLVNGKIVPYTDFTVKFNNSALLEVQVAAEKFNGLLVPMIQLVSLMPNLDICLEHRSDSRQCFAKEPVHCASKESYKHEDDYVDSWLSVLYIEAAKTAVDEASSVLIRNVFLHWKYEGTGEKIYTAQFSLPLDFCKRRNIKFSSGTMLEEIFDPENIHFAESYFLDFICVRYSSLQVTGHKEQDRTTDQLLSGEMSVKWVGHCVITSVTRNEKELKVRVQLHHSTVEPPSYLQSPQINRTPCTIEWIPKAIEARQMECAIRTVPDSGQLAKDIALGKTPVPTVDYRDVEILRQLPAPGLPALDPVQDQAVSTAMKQPFTVVCGQPGTGKSLIAARLIYMLSLRNKMVPVSGVKPQILVCAPTDQSLDILVDYLSRLGQSCPKILRVYDELIEQQEFPKLRGSSLLKWTVSNAKMSTIVQEKIALHHKIRDPETVFGQSIAQYDYLFALYPENITDQQIEEYIATVKKAEMIELSEAEIVMCTCTASARTQIRNSCNINQVVIDNCSMASEPECMIPIVTFDSVKQVVVLGDSQQVPLKVCSPVARNLGLGSSLLHRYRDKAVHLQTQYRMQQDIGDLASLAVSGETLNYGSEDQKLYLNLFTNDKPVTFCQFYGREEATGQGIINQEESNLAVAIASKLVNRHRLGEESIVVMSFYTEQCALISKKLQQKGHKNISVCTVESCQGREWDNVILSTVRTMPGHKVELRSTTQWKEQHLGHLINHSQVSQALTRAKKRLTILGNDNLLKCDAFWENYLQLCQSKGQVLDGRQYLKWMN